MAIPPCIPISLVERAALPFRIEVERFLFFLDMSYIDTPLRIINEKKVLLLATRSILSYIFRTGVTRLSCGQMLLAKDTAVCQYNK
jgi:hypothetical protein